MNTETNEQRTELFRTLFLPSILYAAVYVFLLYKNYGSITMPFFVLATLAYCYYCVKKLHILTLKKMIPYASGMLLLGISTCCTDSLPLQIFNFVGILLLLFCLLLTQFCDVRNWTMVKYASALGNTIVGIIDTIKDFFKDMTAFFKARKNTNHSKIGYVLLGILISIPFLIFVIALFCTADIVFQKVVLNIFDFDFVFGDLFRMIFLFAVVLLVFYSLLRFLNQRKISSDIPDLRRFEPILANTILSLVSVVYLLFSGIQILYLFIGNMTLPDGYTYAQYAREGFFQLLFVCVLNIAVVLFFLGCFRESKLLKILLTVISACTYIMIASSALRMYMYIQVYHLTFLRILVLWFLAVLAIVLIGIVTLIYKRQFPMFRYMLVVISICYIGFSFAHPDYWIAKYNLTHPNVGVLDDSNEYLQELSADAAPVIHDCNEPWVINYRRHMVNDYDDSIRKFNFSRWNAYQLFKK